MVILASKFSPKPEETWKKMTESEPLSLITFKKHNVLPIITSKSPSCSPYSVWTRCGLSADSVERGGAWELIDSIQTIGCLASRVQGWRCVCAALPPPRRSTSVFTSTQVQGAGKQTLSAVMFDPEPRARQGSGEGLSGHWDWPQACGGGGLVGSSLGCLKSPLGIEVQTTQRFTLLNH